MSLSHCHSIPLAALYCWCFVSVAQVKWFWSFSRYHCICPPSLLSLCFRFNGRFPVVSGLAGTRKSPFWICWRSWRWWRGGDTWSYNMCKAAVKCHHQQTNTRLFLQAGCPCCCPTNSVRALKGNLSNASLCNAAVCTMQPMWFRDYTPVARFAHVSRLLRCMWVIGDVGKATRQKLLLCSRKKIAQYSWEQSGTVQ